MKVFETPLRGVLICEPREFADGRGFVVERHRQAEYSAVGIVRPFVQDNHCRSLKNSLRGMHFQFGQPQDKLVDVTRGEILDVVVDVRRESQTWGRWYGVVLSETNHRQIFVPSGFAHGFCVLSDVADIQYKFTDYYRPAQSAGIIWNDPDVGIDWPVSDPTLSARDCDLPRLRDLEQDKFPPYGDGGMDSSGLPSDPPSAP